eukprot:396761_1
MNDDATANKGEKCWKCELCFTVNNLKLSIDKYETKCYCCNTVKYTENKTEIIHSTAWDKPHHYLSQLKEEVTKQCNSFPTDMNETIKNMDIKNTLLMKGYFRQNALKPYKINMPTSIIHYCIFYLYLFEDLYIGNLHKNSSNKPWIHYWTMFISTSKYKLIKPQSIKQVIYEIHPSYRITTIKLNKSPFYLKKGGRGPFKVEAKIIFKQKYNRKDLTCYHSLNFDNYATLTHVEDEKTAKAKAGLEYFFKHEAIQYPNSNDFIIE